MRHSLLLALGLVGTAAALAQSASAPVRESTDPRRAAAVERAAAELKKRPPQPAVGLVRGKTEGGLELLSGGVTQRDRSTMQAERTRFSLWVATVAKPSGAYLADVELQLRDTKAKTPLLVRRMEGPWLMLALPEGRYEVTGTFREPGADKVQTLKVQVNVPRKGQRQAVLRFDSKAEISPEDQGSNPNNPFGAQAPASAPKKK